MNIEALYKIKQKYFLEPKTILDIGACNGWFAGLCKHVWSDSKITLIEANPFYAETLKNTGNPYFITLLGESQKTSVPFYIKKDEPGSTASSIYKDLGDYMKNGNCEIVNLTMNRLDDLIFEGFDFIKIDTQGSEVDIIKGGLNTVRKSKYLLCEVSLKECNEGAPLKKDVLDYLSSIHFEPIDVAFTHTLNGVPFQEDILFVNNCLIQ
jgi:FkbM family methyltransferase